MRLEPLSKCEREFLIGQFVAQKRLDCRRNNDFRPIKLIVGAECGTALCTMGYTKIFCAVSASLVEPSKTRPQKGIISVEVDMSPMGNPNHEHNRLGERGLELTRLLELVLRDSRCIDVESLCVRAEKEVWKIRVDVRILDDDGCLLDCASIAAAAALQHFRRPNVTLEAHKTIIHSEYEKALIPLNIHHMPICVTFGFVKDSNIVIVDPTDKEQQCLSGSLVVACNKRKEVCALHQSTSLVLSTSTISECVRHAMTRVDDVSELVTTVIHEDAKQRAIYKKPIGFETTVNTKMLTCMESVANELVAPGLSCTETSVDSSNLVSNSEVLNVNHLAEGAVTNVNEESLVAKQIEAISSDVMAVDICETAEKRKKRDSDEVADLLGGLDDLEGETMELTPVAEPTIDLMAAKKRKK